MGVCVIEFWDRGTWGGLGDRGCLPVLRKMWWFGFEGIEREDILSGCKGRCYGVGYGRESVKAGVV